MVDCRNWEQAILRKKAMGGGDIKLMALNGLFLGAWPELVMVIAFSATRSGVDCRECLDTLWTEKSAES